MRIMKFGITIEKSRIIKFDIKKIENLKNAVDCYDSSKLESAPKTDRELFDYFLSNTDKVYNGLRNLLNRSGLVVDNEIRAMLGHILDIDINNSNDINLEKAYGHFRRLNIDIFKIICDEFDKFYNDWLNKHYKYDFRNVKGNFLKEFAVIYYHAKKYYTIAQLNERTGSDRMHHSVLSDYSKAAGEYIKMVYFYLQYRNEIERVKHCTDIKRICSYIFDAFCVITSLLSFIK